jgi:hypothetical protein
MELTLIPENQQYASKTHENFIKKTPLKEIVNRYNVDYKRHRANKAIASCIFHTRELLQHLVQHNMLSVELDHTNWFIFSIIEKDQSKKSFLSDVNSNENTNDTLATHDNNVLKIGEMRALNFSDSLANKLSFKKRCINRMMTLIDRCQNKMIDFDLELSDIEHLLMQNKCYYTNLEFTTNDTLTIDRVNSKLGYVKGNVVACRSSVNQVKSLLLESDNPAFKSIYDLKRFVDVLYANIDDNPFKDLLIDDEKIA